jgi:Amidase
MAAFGGRVSGRALRRSIEREPAVAERLNAVFDEYDLVMTPVTAAPPPNAEISNTAGALRTFNQASPYVCYTPTWNYVGQPAASIPAGFDGDGLPRAIQLAGPPSSETTIVSLAAQIEAATPWQRERPAALTNTQCSPPIEQEHSMSPQDNIQIVKDIQRDGSSGRSSSGRLAAGVRWRGWSGCLSARLSSWC